MSVEISLEHYNAIVDEFLNGLNKEAEKIAKEIEMIAIEKYVKMLRGLTHKLLIIGMHRIRLNFIIDCGH